jgi:hypothetical protein
MQLVLDPLSYNCLIGVSLNYSLKWFACHLKHFSYDKFIYFSYLSHL